MSAQNLPPRAASLSLSNLTDDVYGYIYRTTHETSQSSYVGQHIHRIGEGWRRYLGSGVRLTRAIEKHGADTFAKELLAIASSLEELNALEIEHISLERLHGGAQYNIADGGNSFPLPDQAERVALLWQDGDYRATQRESRVSFWSDEEIRAKQSSMVKDLELSRLPRAKDCGNISSRVSGKSFHSYIADQAVRQSWILASLHKVLAWEISRSGGS